MNQPHRPIRIGLTGGVAAGKSLVAERLRTQGIPVIDLDQVSRTLLDTDPETRKAVEVVFGPQAEGIDRRKLREIIFSDKARRLELEAILHPRIWQKFDAESARLMAEGHRIVVCEAPLLIETGHAKDLDALIVVMTGEQLRKNRLISRDGVTEILAEKMMSTQVTDKVRREAATYLVHNDGEPAALDAQLDVIREDWKKRGWC